MGKMTTVYRLAGDDKSPKAYLEATRELITDRLHDMLNMSDSKTVSGQARRAAFGDAIDTIDTIVDDIIAGLGS